MMLQITYRFNQSQVHNALTSKRLTSSDETIPIFKLGKKYTPSF